MKENVAIMADTPTIKPTDNVARLRQEIEKATLPLRPVTKTVRTKGTIDNLPIASNNSYIHFHLSQAGFSGFTNTKTVIRKSIVLKSAIPNDACRSAGIQMQFIQLLSVGR